MERPLASGDKTLLPLGSILRREAAGYRVPVDEEPRAGPYRWSAESNLSLGVAAPSGPGQFRAMAQSDAAARGSMQPQHDQQHGPKHAQIQLQHNRQQQPRECSGLDSNEQVFAQDFKGNTLHLHLTELQSEDQRCVFICRGITNMGFHSQALLKAQFSRYGEVRRVLVTHSKVKPLRGGTNARIRPGSLGFVVMADPQIVVKILSGAPWQTVGGCQIRVEKFQQMQQRSGDLSSQPDLSLDLADSTSCASEPSSGSVTRSRSAQELASSLSELASIMRQALTDGTHAARVLGAAEVASLQNLLEQAGQQYPSQARRDVQREDAVPEHAAQSFQPRSPITAEQAAWAWPRSSSRLAPSGPAPAAPSALGGLRLQNEATHLAKLVEVMRALEGREQVSAMMQESLLSQMTSEHMDKWLQEQRQHLMQLRQMQQLQQMHRQMAELQPQLQQMQQTVDRFTAAAMVAQQPLPAPPSAQPSPLLLAQAVHGLGWPAGMLDPTVYQAAMELAAWQQTLMPPGPASASYASACASHTGYQEPAAFGGSEQQLVALVMEAAAIARADKGPVAAKATSTSQITSSQPAHGRHSGGWQNAECQDANSVGVSTPNRSMSSSTHGKSPNINLENNMTLVMHLTQLQEENPKCVFIARRISGMGFQSQDKLASHFGEFGKVLKVLVAHSKVKPFRRHGTQSRIRPGSLGFIVMETPKCVDKILTEGTEQTVAGCRIWIEPFENIAKPGRASAESASGDSTNGDSTTTGDSTTPGSGSRSGSNGSDKSSADSGSNGSEEGSDKGNSYSGDMCSQPRAEGSQGSSEGQGSSGDSNGGDSQSESSNRATSPGNTREKMGFSDGVTACDSTKGGPR